MTTIQGTRHDFKDIDWQALLPGEYGKNLDNGEWCCIAPGHPKLFGTLRQHQVIEHDDGTITVSPSILIGWAGQEQWHGYIEQGIWREV